MAKAADIVKIAPKYLGTPYSEMDCQAFVEACLTDIGINENLAGSNAWYRHMTWTGTPEECKASFGRIPVGAFLFILKNDGKEPEKYKPDGIGNASHIGIYTGLSGAEMCDIAIGDGVGDADRYNFGNGAIHSSASRGHVCTSNFSGKSISGGWNRIGLWDKLNYDIDEGGEKMQAIVYAPTGKTVNMRMMASAQAPLAERIPIGEQVTVNKKGDGWSEITYKSKTGYVMNEFLVFDTEATIQVSKSRLEAIYNELGDILGMRG